MDTVAVETFAEWKLLVNAIQQNPPTLERDQVTYIKSPKAEIHQAPISQSFSLMKCQSKTKKAEFQPW